MLLLILLIGWSVLLCSSTEFVNLSSSAFCQSFPTLNTFGSVDHPMPVPEMHIPWVWEAVHDPVMSHVDVSVMTPNACSFDRPIWKEFHDQFPMYESYTGNGLSSNVLVSSECKDYRINLNYFLGIVGKTVDCVYHHQGFVVQRVLSLKVRHNPPTFGPLLIRCPVPSKLQFDSLHLEIKAGFSPFCVPKFGRSSVGYVNATRVFPVCTLPTYDKLQKKYDLSIVSATARADENKTVEWIEYYRLLGVQHFFLYNTAILPSVIEAINMILSPYVQEGLVTLVPWHFLNCVRGMASGRKASFYAPNEKYNKSDPKTWIRKDSYSRRNFRPPHPIANYAALMSGYSRFRHTSTYILYVDDDEFVSLSADVSSTARSLVDTAKHSFSQHSNASAIYFLPIDMKDCPDTDTAQGRVRDTSLPRVGNLLYGHVAPKFEHKPLMRTDMVALFSVHYINLLDLDFYNSSHKIKEYFYPITQGALLHYKTPAHISGDPFSYGEALPIPENITQSHHCKESVRTIDPFETGDNISGHVFPAELRKMLVDNVTKRLLVRAKQR